MSQHIKCRATSRRSGLQCNNWAVTGSLVCRMHGAGGDRNNPAHSGAHKAKERVEDAEATLRQKLWEMHEPALNAVQDVINDPNAKAQDRLRAAEAILNRFVPQKAETKIKVDHSEERDLDEEIAGALGLEESDTA
jgi:hypothetical protein